MRCTGWKEIHLSGDRIKRNPAVRQAGPVPVVRRPDSIARRQQFPRNRGKPRVDRQVESQVGAIHYLSVSTECGNPATEVLCTSGTPRLSPRLLRMEPGTYFVTLSTTLSSGDVSLTARTEPPTETPTNDTCDGAIPLVNGVEARGSLLGASDTALLCGADGSRDTFYRLELTERRNVTLVARRADGSTEPLALALFSGTCAAPDAPRCASGSPALLNRTLEAGTHYVAVESIPSFAGSYVLTAYLAAP